MIKGRLVLYTYISSFYDNLGFLQVRINIGHLYQNTYF